jgi:dolichol-phosphate mannosyltransferase
VPSKVSIVIPIYNEELNIVQVINRVLDAPLPPGVDKEVIVVDDGSTDRTTQILKGMDPRLVNVHQSVLNLGKGTAIRIGLKQATGDVLIIQDGDNEYNPSEIIDVVRPILEGKERVVYGSRFLGTIKSMRMRYRLANRLLVWAVWLFYGTKITDEATAYKAFHRDVLRSTPLSCQRFEFCPEFTAKVLRQGIRIHEVPITYNGRTIEEGKKIRLRDGFEAFWTLLRFSLWRKRT